MAMAANVQDLEKSYVRRLSSAASGLLAVGFWFTAFLFGAATYSALANDTLSLLWQTGSLLWKFSIAIYFTSWILGVRFDKEREVEVYQSAPREGRLDWTSGALALFIFVLFGIMYLVEDIGSSALHQDAAPKSFLGAWLLSTALLLPYKPWILQFSKTYGDAVLLGVINTLWFFNVFIWRYFVRNFIRPMEARSRDMYQEQGDYFKLEMIRIFHRYIDGQWQWRRFIYGCVYLLLLDGLLAVSLIAPDLAGGLFGGGSGGSGIEARGSVRIVLAIMFTGFVVGIEGWVWLERFRTKFTLRNLEEASQRYVLSPHP